jgi:hypothetical protein
MHSMYRGRIAHNHRGAMMMGGAHAAYHGQHQRFAVTPNEAGGSRIALDDTETVTLGTDPETGAVTIEVSPKPAATNGGNGGTAALAANGRTVGRQLTNLIRGAGRIRQRMSVLADNDGSIVVRPEDDNSLMLVGDPDSGAVAIVELEPTLPPTNGENGE